MSEEKPFEWIPFEELYQNLSPAFPEIEAQRRVYLAKARRKGLIWTLAIVGFVLLFMFMTDLLGESVNFLMLILFGVITFLIAARTPVAYLDLYKDKIITPFVETLVEKGSYNPQNGLDEDAFMESALFRRPDEYMSEDGITGKIGKTAIFFAEVRAKEKKVTTNSRGQTRTKWINIFSGTFFVADFNKNFKGKTVVTDDYYFFRDNRIKLENPDFERKFRTYATDGIEARYILSPALMERIVNLSKRRGLKKIQLSFVKSRMMIAIPDRVDHFETSIWAKANDAKVLRREYDLLCSMVDIVEELNLNTRIWTKA